MKKIILGGYSGKENRGTEAIACSTANMFHSLGKDVVIAYKSENNIEQPDCDLYDGYVSKKTYKSKALKLFNSVWRRVFRNIYPYSKLCYQDILKEVAEGMLVHIGGDTYCYGTSLENNALVHLANKQKTKTVLWGVSIEQNSMDDPLTKETLKKYDKIYAREALSYDLFIKYGFVPEKVFKTADPAFMLSPKEVILDSAWWDSHKVIGINLSPFVMSENSDSILILEGCKKLILRILKTTDYNIALIPHVWINEAQGDYVPLNMLQDYFAEEERVRLIHGNYSCRELKYIISKCYTLMAARTHASIAAYSSCVPTLVLGYSIKSKGIATDLFGNYEGYVLPMQDISDASQVCNAYMEIIKNHDSIEKKLKDTIPSYKQLAYAAAKDVVENFMN